MKNFSYEVKEFKKIPTIYLYGEIDTESSNKIKTAYKHAGEKMRDKLIINFKNVSYINSAGIASLISIVSDASKKNIKVYFVGLSDYFKKVMQIVGVTEFVEIREENADVFS